MKTVSQKLSPVQRAEAESRAGRLWRAKEILSGYIGSAGYLPETFAAYGRILLQMQDTKEAGKYLLLSGLASNDKENGAVEVFLQNLRGKSCGWIFSRFPGAARRTALADYPPRVQAELKRLGFPADFHQDTSIVPAPVKWASKLSMGCAFVGVISLFGIMIFGIVHGLSVIADWILGK